MRALVLMEKAIENLFKKITNKKGQQIIINKCVFFHQLRLVDLAYLCRPSSSEVCLLDKVFQDNVKTLS